MYRRRCWPCWISRKIILSNFLLVLCLVLLCSVNPFDVAWKFVTIETNIPIVSIYIILEENINFQTNAHCNLQSGEFAFCFWNWKKPGLIKFHIFDVAIGTKKMGNLLVSSHVVILEGGFSVAFVICIKCQKLKLFNEYKQVKNL